MSDGVKMVEIKDMAGKAVTVTIETLVQEGRGLARQDGKVLLVRGAMSREHRIDEVPVR